MAIAVAVADADAKRAGTDCCKFELEEYKTTFTLPRVHMLKSYDTEPYRCEHCDEDRHVGCIRLAEEIQLGSRPGNIFSMRPVFTLVNRAQKGVERDHCGRYDDDGDNTIWRIRIVLKRRRNTDGSGWEGILKGAFNIATDVARIGLTQILIDLI
ncbi:hypothetical protein CDL15_Pgr002276 [Punica granatum]|uniref:Uncharacterized protein n=1 Tax=Punica granatum TaxID=22663 RepID=A0A218WHV2_PUNGR|nr:hypothetical protein CDL15_Pgr002276 [Punica granatum]